MHGGRGVCQWCARSSPVETRQNPRPRTTTTATTINSNNNSNNNDIDNVGGRRNICTNVGSGEGSYKNPVSNNDNNNKNIRNIGDSSSRRGARRRRRQRCCCRAVSSRPGVVSARRGVAPFFTRRRC